MSNNKKKDYEVGYKKPPVATRFQKGVSGNPSGRRKKEPELIDPGKGARIVKAFNSIVTMRFNEGPIRALGVA